MAKKRLDILLTDKGLYPSREKARAVIMSGVVFVNGQRADKPGATVDEDCQLEIHGGESRFVSRGGHKLLKAVEHFGLDLGGLVCADCGASTGGFTDCMLQHGASKVFAIDVGYGQLAWSLRTDPRVVCMERTNVRYLKPEDLGQQVDFVSVDVSFISLKLILPAVRAILKEDGQAVCLIKPQFEAGRENVGKKGVVRDPKVHQMVIEQFLETARDEGFVVTGLTYSPIRGPEGNIEYLGWLRGNGETTDVDPAALVELSHRELDG